MIKQFMKKIEETSSEAMIAVLVYIDGKLDAHDKRLDRHRKQLSAFEEKLNNFENGFNNTKAEVDSNIDRKKGMYKTAVNAVIVAIIAYILSRLGIS